MTKDMIEVRTLRQDAPLTDWRWRLAHDRPYDRLIWTTRGQGRVLLHGTRRGLGPHNALFVPAHSLFALDISVQASGYVMSWPAKTSKETPTSWPCHPLHLRLRETRPIAEMTAHFDAALREAPTPAANGAILAQDALHGHMALISVWLRRQAAHIHHAPRPANAAARLSARYCAKIVKEYRSGKAVAEHAATLGVTATHLARACKAATGHTAAGLLTQRLVFAARQHLLEPQMPIREVAQALGFASAAYFTRFIQAQTGHTPTGLRAAELRRM